jgi:two-component system response regulator RegA
VATNSTRLKTYPTVSKVLLVEDDAALAGYLRSSLLDAGYEAEVASAKDHAIRMLAANPNLGLMLLDLGLPPHASTMSEGLTVLDEALRLAPGIKVIVLTGQDEDTAALEAIRRGAFDFLVKPASLTSIHAALGRARLFNQTEGRMTQAGEARLQLTARLWEGPKEAASNAEEQLLRRALVANGYNIAEVARQLGMAREHVYYYLNKYGLRRPD